MSLLGAAKRLASSGALFIVDFDTNGEPYEDDDPYASAHWVCVGCSVRQKFTDDGPFVHRDDCPTFALPQIVAALEAAERLTAAWRLNGSSTPIPGSYSGYYVEFERGKRLAAAIDEASAALVAALKGETPAPV